MASAALANDPVIAGLIDWNDDCYADLLGLGVDQAANDIGTSISPMSGGTDLTPEFVSDIRDVLNGSAIEVIHTIAGRRVEFELDDCDDAVVTVDGVEVARYDASILS